MAVTNASKWTALQVMQDAPVIPVIVLHDVAHAVPMARALVAGGIRMLEVTLRTPQALACMEAIAHEVPDAVVGAGTVRSPADAAAAAKAGAQFAVSPGYTKAVGQACRDHGLSLLPGVATGSEIMMAQEDGYTELKFFPAMQAGGPNMLKVRGGMIAQALAGEKNDMVTVNLATMRKDVKTMLAQGQLHERAMPLTTLALASFERASSDGLDAADCAQYPVWWLQHGSRG